MQIAVGGCLAQKDRDAVLKRAPWVDVVFGTHNIGSLPTLLDRARHNRVAQVEIVESLQGVSVDVARVARIRLCRMGFDLRWLQQHLHVLHRAVAARQGDRPQARRRPRRGAVAGRAGRARGHPAGSERQRLRRLLRHGRALARGPDDLGRRVPRPRGVREAAARVRSHRGPRARALHLTASRPSSPTTSSTSMAVTPNVCPTLHMPLQSGSDRILKAMRRSYRAERYLGIIDRVRSAIPHAAITTDLIVGFPGETEEDFAATLDVVERAQVRQRLHVPVLQAARHSRRRASRPASESRCAGALHASDRAPGANLPRGERRPDRNDESSCSSPPVRAARTPAPRGCPGARATGGWCTSRPASATSGPATSSRTTVTCAAPHHLIADATVLEHRRTRAGDAHEAGCA